MQSIFSYCFQLFLMMVPRMGLMMPMPSPVSGALHSFHSRRWRRIVVRARRCSLRQECCIRTEGAGACHTGRCRRERRIACHGRISPFCTSRYNHLGAQQTGRTGEAPIPRMLYAMHDASLSVMCFRLCQPVIRRQAWGGIGRLR